MWTLLILLKQSRILNCSVFLMSYLIGRKTEGREKIEEWRWDRKERKTICFSFPMFGRRDRKGRKKKLRVKL